MSIIAGNTTYFVCDGCGRIFNLDLVKPVGADELCPACYEAKGSPTPLSKPLPRVSEAPPFICVNCSRTYNAAIRKWNGLCPNCFEEAGSPEQPKPAPEPKPKPEQPKETPTPEPVTVTEPTN